MEERNERERGHTKTDTISNVKRVDNKNKDNGREDIFQRVSENKSETDEKRCQWGYPAKKRT